MFDSLPLLIGLLLAAENPPRTKLPLDGFVLGRDAPGQAFGFGGGFGARSPGTQPTHHFRAGDPVTWESLEAMQRSLEAMKRRVPELELPRFRPTAQSWYGTGAVIDLTRQK